MEKDKQLNNYWFYILKEVVMEFGYATSENIEKDVFISEDRNSAKKYLKELFPNLPLRKPKDATVGTRYLYLTDSTEYWHHYHHGDVDVQCSYCGKEERVKGVKNVIKNRAGSYCSTDCKESHEKMMADTSDYITSEDHCGIGSLSKEKVVGYIYKITNKHTMKSYVGQTVNPPVFRWWQHLKVDRKFEQVDITDIVFEVLEIVTYDPNTDSVYENAKDKLTKREAFYIKRYECVEEGYNSVQPKEEELTLFHI